MAALEGGNHAKGEPVVLVLADVHGREGGVVFGERHPWQWCGYRFGGVSSPVGGTESMPRGNSRSDAPGRSGDIHGCRSLLEGVVAAALGPPVYSG